MLTNCAFTKPKQLGFEQKPHNERFKGTTPPYHITPHTVPQGAGCAIKRTVITTAILLENLEAEKLMIIFCNL
jgi:hypothetical protein